jgi:hypothetical protein
MVILNNSYNLRIRKKLNSLISKKVVKVKASTIVETLIASIIIIIIFSIASMTLNNLFKSNIDHDSTTIETQLTKLQYLHENNKLTTPYYENYKGWSVNIKEVRDNYKKSILIEASKDKKQFNKKNFDVGY